MRLALLGFHHETNTFASAPTGFDAFARGLLRGDAIRRAHAEATSSVAGFLETGRRFDCEVVPLVFASTNPSGLITADAFARLADELVGALRASGPWDGVLLALHGAAVAEGFPDADGEMAARVREAVGPAVPIGLALDLHGNLTPRMVDSVTATVLYRTNPHVDPRPRALECGEIIVRTLKGEVRPVQALVTPPLVINIVRQYSGEEPMRGLMADVDAVIARPGMLSASIAEGFPYADVPELGMAFLAVHDGDKAAAQDAAQWLARRAWARRAEFTAAIPAPEEALRHAMAAPRGPVLLMDVGDNTPGGTAGDSTVLLDTAQRLGVRRFLQTLYDPEAVAACAAAGAGATLTLRVGGKSPDAPHPPVEVRGTVVRLSDGKFEDPRPTHGGARFFDAGQTAVLQTADEHTLVLTSRVIGNTSIEQMYSLGIRPEEYQVVVAKGVVSPRPAYGPIAAEVLLVNTPGVTSADLGSFTYQHRRRPLYPFEDLTPDPFPAGKGS